MTLFSLTLLLSLLFIALAVGLLAIPERMQAALQAFPRHVLAARVLLLVEIPWAVLLLLREPPFAGNEGLSRLILLAAPVAYLLVVVFMKELLAPRCLGGLFLLAAAPYLAQARWHESAWRYVILVLAYLFIVAGILLVMNPYKFRRTVRGLVEHASVCRRTGIVSGIFGAALLLLALTVYRSV